MARKRRTHILADPRTSLAKQRPRALGRGEIETLRYEASPCRLFLTHNSLDADRKRAEYGNIKPRSSTNGRDVPDREGRIHREVVEIYDEYTAS